ncbi:hypothetical protein A3B42_02875 [Candidatus Daviesbacteria bacterium RIFCSPLOWO2_01_FULL_38_10]|uniref:Prepilin-type N-terminal cleavage/methylation domain-containing protein n=1 Tax=Candidatus Daviesbacteria bacterium GW2011_GWF2_38_6 TaxID=1618432 RepID=A0A0G0KLY9_9BACT|nr:MAG: hypothetical protein US80_C0004G0039 [Candidatus Daviesbacteria bacterium GW2011_GWA2_38_17]KKQ76515.1 MAG: hypothetical protein US99_C0070G0017 [Candidatus Daviesbacteria bacterium GW2011_GWF2_38_6]OGE26973.1 MAG: hypothetical protein A3D02_01265 [Candidatus Daviesbacteria bacterium RIFCSPHIGHO2_02_FULL_39_41]OGE37950.1 MAG: hypothetical protein A3B42_02875 [Candidatus Daviesbacteria bacterium RIFCSPLOWO2_01_FULL_38_10]OGE44048.1 MAG: hypothetical protein A3E67_01325 [Candidatus Davies
MKGLTLIEVLISMGIAVVVGGLLFVIIVNSAGLFYKQSSKIEQGVSANDALSAVRNSIKEAQSIAANYPETPPFTYTTGRAQLVLKLASIDLSGNIIADSFDYFVFHLDQTKLRFKVFPNVLLSQRKSRDQILSTNAENLEFKYYNLANPPAEVTPVSAAKIKITLSLEQKSGQIMEKSVATTEANLRND